MNDQLVAIATSMNQNLTDLLAIMQVGAAQSGNQCFGSGNPEWIRIKSAQ
jgi:hypothetical protein